MIRNELISMIKLLHQDMEQLTVDAGISPELYMSIIEHDDNTTDVELEALHTWLQILYEGPFAAVAKVWKLHPVSRWNYYFRMGEELTEIRLLRKARSLLNEAWKKPYHFSSRPRRAKKSDIQSERAGSDGDNLGQHGPKVLGASCKRTDRRNTRHPNDR